MLLTEDEVAGQEGITESQVEAMVEANDPGRATQVPATQYEGSGLSDTQGTASTGYGSIGEIGPNTQEALEGEAHMQADAVREARIQQILGEDEDEEMVGDGPDPENGDNPQPTPVQATITSSTESSPKSTPATGEW